LQAVFAFHDFTDAWEGEVFRIEALTAGSGAFDQCGSCRSRDWLVAIECHLPGGLLDGHHVTVHRIAEGQHTCVAGADEIARMARGMPLELNRFDDTRQQIRARLEGRYLWLDRSYQGGDLLYAVELRRIVGKAA